MSSVQTKGKKKKKKPRNKSNFLFDNFSYRAELAPRSKLAGWRKSMLEETKKELKISIFSGEAKKILLCKVGVRLPSLPLFPTFYWEEPNLTTLAKNDKIPSTTLTSFVPFVLMPLIVWCSGLVYLKREKRGEVMERENFVDYFLAFGLFCFHMAFIHIKTGENWRIRNGRGAHPHNYCF